MNLRAHPAADLFPMLSDAELDAMAADIKENGHDNLPAKESTPC